MRHLTEIIVHCSATRPTWFSGRNNEAQFREIKRWHTEDRGWSDIGYHYIIFRDGSVMAGRPLRRTGAHVKGKNKGTIGICLIGGHSSSETDKFRENFTPAQDRALRKLIKDLQTDYPSIRKVSGHNQYAAKACPGFKVEPWLKSGVMQSPIIKEKNDLNPVFNWLDKLFGRI